MLKSKNLTKKSISNFEKINKFILVLFFISTGLLLFATACFNFLALYELGYINLSNLQYTLIKVTGVLGIAYSVLIILEGLLNGSR